MKEKKERREVAKKQFYSATVQRTRREVAKATSSARVKGQGGGRGAKHSMKRIGKEVLRRATAKRGEEKGTTHLWTLHAGAPPPPKRPPLTFAVLLLTRRLESLRQRAASNSANNKTRHRQSDGPSSPCSSSSSALPPHPYPTPFLFICCPSKAKHFNLYRGMST